MNKANLSTTIESDDAQMVWVSKIGRDKRAWWVYALLGILATAVYFLLPGAARNAFYDALALSAVVAMMLGVHRNQPQGSLGWHLLSGRLNEEATIL